MSGKTHKTDFLFKLSLLSFLNIAILSLLFIPLNRLQPTTKSSQANQEAIVKAWWYTQTPKIYIYGGDYEYAGGGLVPLASTGEPAVQISAYNVSGNAKFELYEATMDDVFEYLIYKNDNEQVNKNVDTSKLKFLTSFEEGVKQKINLPLEDKGIYFLKVSIDDVEANAYILRSNIGSVVKEAGDEFIFWSQDLRSKRSLSSGNVQVYNLEDERTQISNVPINDEGISRAALTAQADIALVTQGDEYAIVPINLKYLNSGSNHDWFPDFEVKTNFFSFTDRPLYSPGDTVYFKSIVRNDNDARYTIPTGTVEVTMSNYSREAPIYDEVLQVSSTGTVTGEIKLPENIKTGGYAIHFGRVDDSFHYTNSINIEVQNFRKPEYFLELTADKRELISGDKAEIKVHGEYFSGQPLQASNVEYKVYSSDFYDYQYYDQIGRQISTDYRYGWWRSNVIDSGRVDLDSQGNALIPLETKSDKNEGKAKVYSIEVRYQGATSDQSFDRKNILVYPGEFGVYQTDRSWGIRSGDQFSTTFKLASYDEDVLLGGRELKVNIVREYYDKSSTYYERKTEHISEHKNVTNESGELDFQFTPQSEGTYKINVSAIDDRGNEITKIFAFYASAADYSRYSPEGSGGLSITPDKNIYEPGDLANIVLHSSIPDRDVFLSFDRETLNRFQVVRMQGNTTELDLPLVTTDMPNIYLSASSFGNGTLDWATENIEVSAERMHLQVELTADSEKYGPGDTALVNVETKDINGNPVAADVAVWAVDKAIYELESDPLRDIHQAFWRKRGDNTTAAHSLEGIMINQSEGGGCFAIGTKILMNDGTSKNIEDIKVGDLIKTRKDPLSDKMVNAKVTETTVKEVAGYLLINGRLRITDNHVLLVNGQWKEAADIRNGDLLATVEGLETVNSIEWHLGKTTVYNLEIEDQHTFFADGIYVHNQKGGESREVLEDTAYWNPSVFTGSDGVAQVAIKLPDNLTTWAVAAVAATNDTKVGQQRMELLVTKDLIIRPIIPNLLREGDEIVLSALAQNFTDEDKTFNVLLEFDSGEVEEPEKTDILIKSNETEQVFWNVKPNQLNEEAELRFIMYETNDETSGDNLLRTIPVKKFGFKETAGFSAIGGHEYKVNLNGDSVNDETKIKLNIAPSIFGSLPASMEYLIDYPYGCVEQTVSRFVPSVIVKQNSSLFPDIAEEKDLDDIIEKGIARLISQQQSDGSWGWWYSKGNSYMTSYVVEYLLKAQELGYDIDQTVFNRAKFYFNQLNPIDEYDRVTKYYALTLLGSEGIGYSPQVENLSDFLLSMLVIANKKQGINDNNANGYNELVRRAKQQGDTVYWENIGDSRYFSSIDATTAMAIRAIIEVGGDRDLAVRASQYLVRNRKKHYWSNTYGTANVIRAITDLANTGNEQNPNYTYQILLDDKVLSSGSITSGNQVVRQIEIPAEDIATEGSKIKLVQNGIGQMYSTLVVEEFRTDRNYEPEGKALTVKREMVNSRDPYLSLGVGEVAKIRLTIEGISNNSEYIVVEDTLPSGMVPVIESFDNEQFERDGGFEWGKEYKADGVVFSRPMFYLNSDHRVLEYKARVINSGVFNVPPAYAELMYSPEVNGLSKSETVTIDHEPRELPRPERRTNTLINDQRVRVAITMLLGSILSLILIEKKTGYISSRLKKLRNRFKNNEKLSGFNRESFPEEVDDDDVNSIN